MGRILHKFSLLIILFIFFGQPAFAGRGNLVRPAHSVKISKFKKHSPPVDVITTSTGGTVICVGSNITLTASAALPGATYQWYGNTFLIPGATNQTYTTNLPGTYYVIATYLGVPDQYPSIVLTSSTPPSATFTYSSNSICGNTPINYVSTVTGGPGPITYLWDFGDGVTSTLANPSHIFVAANGGGTQMFTVKLTVTNADGCSSTVSTVVTINLPSAALAGNNTLVSYNGDGKTYFRSCSNSAFQFTFVNQSTSTNSSYYIDWGDGSAPFSSTTFSSSLNHTYARVHGN